MNARRVPLIVGLILALGTGILLLNYLGSLRRSSVAMTQTRSVVVAATDIPARAVIKPQMISVVTRAADQLDSDALADPKRAAGQMALISIPAGSTISQSKVVPVAALALPMRLKNGLRAVSISIDRVKGVSGLLQPGDRVDVIAVPPRVSNETPRATTIIRGALVLAMGNETETAQATPSPDNQNLTTVTLALSPQQANLIALADVNTTLRLALRSPQEPLRAFPTETLQLGVAPQPAAPQNVAPQPILAVAPHPAPAQAQPPKTKTSFAIPVLDGDRFVQTTKNQ